MLGQNLKEMDGSLFLETILGVFILIVDINSLKNSLVRKIPGRKQLMSTELGMLCHLMVDFLGDRYKAP